MIPIDNIRFLIIDNNEHMRHIVRMILRSLGATEVREAADSTEGLAAVKRFNPDIIILEAVLKPLSGLELTRQIRRDIDGTNPFVPIIMTSVPSKKEDVLAARDAGVTEFCAKPLSARGLYTHIKQVILSPRPFIKAKEYVGPDRRRHKRNIEEDDQKRESDQKNRDKAIKSNPGWAL